MKRMMRNKVRLRSDEKREKEEKQQMKYFATI